MSLLFACEKAFDDTLLESEETAEVQSQMTLELMRKEVGLDIADEKYESMRKTVGRIPCTSDEVNLYYARYKEVENLYAQIKINLAKSWLGIDNRTGQEVYEQLYGRWINDGDPLIQMERYYITEYLQMNTRMLMAREAAKALNELIPCDKLKEVK